MIAYDYTRAKNVKPLRPSRDLGKFFDNAERGAWEVLKSYDIKQKKGQVLPDQTITDKHAEADVRVACRVLENIERGRIYWKALKGERNRAEALVFNVATIMEQLNGAATKAVSAGNSKRAKKERVPAFYEPRNNAIRARANKLILEGVAGRNVITDLIKHAKDKGLAWPMSRKPYVDILLKK
ncbi:MAG: hypothetical protein HY273_14680 [Gammaproteobacteria bacterium]|nr:hypothetical protein [Gammaproteobacteria bacterium]